MIIVCVNLIAVVALALVNVDFVISFEVAFVGAWLIFFSSYRAIMQRINDNKSSLQEIDSHKSNLDSNPENLSKKERFFIGFRISFGLLRLLSYAFLGISIVALINNGAFFLLPFLAGIALSTLTSAIYAIKRKT